MSAAAISDPGGSDPDAVIAVAGGGIAGAACCLALAKAGRAVTWLAPPLPDAARPGESLAAAAVPLLARLGLAHLLDHPAHRRAAVSFTAWGSDALLESSAIARPGGMGHVIDRGRLEADLAAAAGCRPEVRLIDDSLADFARADGHWQVETSGGQRLRAGFLVDATGRAAAIGRRLAAQKRADRLIAAYAFLEQTDDGIDPTPATLVEAVRDGWWYATLLADRRLAVNFYSDPDLMPAGLARDPAAWRRMIAESRYIARWVETGGLEIGGPPQLTGAGTAWLDQAAGPGWMAVGDAAAALDPLSAHGMTTALWTGIEAARALCRAQDGDPAALPAYADRVLRGVERYRIDRQRIHLAESRFAGAPFWQRRTRHHDAAAGLAAHA
ncbi:glycine oxidase maturase GoxB [Marinibaculum pumilum]|uniref:Glycine oxidase maturase GoxB n=1 Tax=Marinibaculum pumilum TaxID=1766165 RepID=A0ABV7L4H2_9PROT